MRSVPSGLEERPNGLESSPSGFEEHPPVANLMPKAERS